MKFYKVFITRPGNEQELRSRIGHLKVGENGPLYLRLYLFQKEFFLFEDQNSTDAEAIYKVCVRRAQTEGSDEVVFYKKIGELRFRDYQTQNLVFHLQWPEGVLPQELCLSLEERVDS
jgi:hypothetical protein